MIWTLAQVALGGAVGAVARFLCVAAAGRLAGGGFPWGTLAVNAAGSLAMGAIVVWLASRDALRLAPLLMAGVLGGFTTFSAFSLDAVALAERGRLLAAGGYVAGSVGLSIGALLLGMALMRGMLT
jgi:CrcB protein